ncbi:MAG: hypothetical protein VYD26_04790 [Actinomycetota bacterium]|mgnify:CR=1 FL=1|nr:hypothetical protein [Actinomycetota bacterium]
MEKEYNKPKKNNRIITILILLLSVILISCTSGETVNPAETVAENKDVKFDYEKGIGKNTDHFILNWNKLVSEVSTNEETIAFFSLNPNKLRWMDWKRDTLVYQFGNDETALSGFTLNLNINPETEIVYGIEFFAPATKDSIVAEQTKFFFLLLVAISDPELDRDGRESVLSNLGLYESVDTPELMSGSLTKNNINYQLEPLVDNNLLIGITLFVTDKSSTTPS